MRIYDSRTVIKLSYNHQISINYELNVPSTWYHPVSPVVRKFNGINTTKVGFEIFAVQAFDSCQPVLLKSRPPFRFGTIFSQADVGIGRNRPGSRAPGCWHVKNCHFFVQICPFSPSSTQRWLPLLYSRRKQAITLVRPH